MHCLFRFFHWLILFRVKRDCIKLMCFVSLISSCLYAECRTVLVRSDGCKLTMFPFNFCRLIVAYRVRLSHNLPFAAKVKLDGYVNNTWTPVCHPVGIADRLCQIQGFESAENNANCDMIQTHPYGNTTCGNLQRMISNCSEPHRVAAVCRGTTSK